jgi:hypothetical protein
MCTQKVPNPLPFGGYSWRVRTYSQGVVNLNQALWSNINDFTALSINSVPMSIQSGDSRIVSRGAWTAAASERAMSDDYLVSAANSGAELELTVEGASVDVLYVAGPEYGAFVIEIDDVAALTVDSHAAQVAYGQIAHVAVAAGQHTIRITAADGARIAIDAIIVDGQVVSGTQPIVIPTLAPTIQPTIESTAQPSPEVTAEPTLAPTQAPTVEPTAAPTSSPTVEPTAAPTLEPTAQPSAEATQEVSN